MKKNFSIPSRSGIKVNEFAFFFHADRGLRISWLEIRRLLSINRSKEVGLTLSNGSHDVFVSRNYFSRPRKREVIL